MQTRLRDSTSAKAVNPLRERFFGQPFWKDRFRKHGSFLGLLLTYPRLSKQIELSVSCWIRCSRDNAGHVSTVSTYHAYKREGVRPYPACFYTRHTFSQIEIRGRNLSAPDAGVGALPPYRCHIGGHGLRLDGFKQVNDRYGHLEGDKLLRLFAEEMKEGCREYDYVARMGGDEFVVVAPGMKLEAVSDKVSRLNQLAIEAGRRVCGQDLVSLSVGTALCPTDGLDAESLLAEADRKMYTMKKVHHALAECLETLPEEQAVAQSNSVN